VPFLLVSGFICSALQELTAHRFDSIHDQVQHHLPQLHAIAENRENVVRAQRLDRYLFLFASSATKSAL
jgi:hypothetical protein